MFQLKEPPMVQAGFHHWIAMQHGEGGGSFQRSHKAFARQWLLTEFFGLFCTYHEASGMGIAGEIEVHCLSSSVNTSCGICSWLHELTEVLGIEGSIHE